MMSSSTWMPLISFSIKIAFRWLTTGMMPARILARSPSVWRALRRFSTACADSTGWVKKPVIPFSNFSTALGLEVSMQMAREALPYADGFYLMTPFNRVALMERLIARLKTELLDAEG